MKNFIQQYFQINGTLRNVVWASASGLVLALLSFFFTPIFTDLVGIEGYSFINIWMVSVVIMSIFDFGLNLTINNIIADQTLESNAKNNFFLVLEKRFIRNSSILLGVAIAVLFLIYYFLGVPLEHYQFYNLIVIAAVFQLPFSFYVNVLFGKLKVIEASKYTIFFNSIKYLFGLLVLYISNSLFLFFFLQIILSVFQSWFIRMNLFKELSLGDTVLQLSSHKELLKAKFSSFSTNLMILSFSSIMFSHLDRIWVLSTRGITDYGLYAISFTAASILQLVIQPFYKAYFPKFSEMASAKPNQLAVLFFSSSVIINAVLIVITINAVFFSETLLTLWLGKLFSIQIEEQFRIILIGLCLSGFYWIPAAYMQSLRKPKFHTNIIIISIFVSLVILVLAEKLNLNLSAGLVWIIHGILLLLFETRYLTKKFKPFNAKIWLSHGVFIPALLCIGIAWMFHKVNQFSTSSTIGILLFMMSMGVSLFLIFLFYRKFKYLKNALQ